MSLTAHALTTYAEAKGEIGLDDDALQAKVERIINAVSEAMEDAAGSRHFEYGAALAHDVQGLGGARLIVPRAPVVSITKVELLNLDGTVSAVIDASSYTVDNAASGLLYRAAGWPISAHGHVGIRLDTLPGSQYKGIRITYGGGYITPQQVIDDTNLTRTLPFDLEEACLVGVVSIFRRRSSDRSVKSKSMSGAASTTYRDQESIVPDEVLNTAKRYWREGQ